MEELRTEFNKRLKEINTSTNKNKTNKELVAVDKELETLKVTLEGKRELLDKRETADIRKEGFRKLIFFDTRNIELELFWLKLNKPEEDTVSLFLGNINDKEEDSTHRDELKKDFIDLMKVLEEVSVSVKDFLNEKISSVVLPNTIEINEVKELLINNNVETIKGDGRIKRHMVKKFNFCSKQLISLSIVLYEIYKDCKSFEINDLLIEKLKKKDNGEEDKNNGTEIVFTNYDRKSNSSKSSKKSSRSNSIDTKDIKERERSKSSSKESISSKEEVERKRERQKEEEERAALLIQKKYKQKMKEMEEKQRAEEEKAALLIQRKYKQKMKEKMEKKIKKKQDKAARLIQKKYKQKRKEMKEKRKEEEEKAALKIQSLYKVKLEKRKLDRKMKAIVFIQKMVKAYLQRRNYRKLKSHMDKIESSNNNKLFKEEKVEADEKLPTSNNNISGKKEVSCDNDDLEGSDFDDFLEEETIRESAFNPFDSRTIDDENIRNSIYSKNSNIYSNPSQFKNKEKRSTINAFKEPKSMQPQKRSSNKKEKEKGKTLIDSIKYREASQLGSNMKNTDTNFYDKFPTYKSISSVSYRKETDRDEQTHNSRTQSGEQQIKNKGFALSETIKIEIHENVSQSIQQKKIDTISPNKKEEKKQSQMNKLIQSVVIDKEDNNNHSSNNDINEEISNMFSKVMEDDYKEASKGFLKNVFKSAISKMTRKSQHYEGDKIVKSEIQRIENKEEPKKKVKEVEEIKEEIKESGKKSKKRSKRKNSEASYFDTSSFEEYNC